MTHTDIKYFWNWLGLHINFRLCSASKSVTNIFIDKVFFFIFFFQDPIERLGCHPQTGFADITSHVFFRAVDWEQVNRACDVDQLIGFRFIEVISNQKLNTFQTMLFNFFFFYLISWKHDKLLRHLNQGLKIGMDWETLIHSLQTNPLCLLQMIRKLPSAETNYKIPGLYREITPSICWFWSHDLC